MSDLPLRVVADPAGLAQLKTLVGDLKSIVLGSEGVRAAMSKLSGETSRARAVLAELEATTTQVDARIKALTQTKVKDTGATQAGTAATKQSSSAKLKDSAVTTKLTDAEKKEAVAATAAAAAHKKMAAAAVLNTRAHGNLHSVIRGVSGGMGALWTTYGNLLPMLGGLAVTMGLRKAAQDGAEFEYQMKFIQGITQELETTVTSAGEAILKLGENSLVGPLKLAEGMRILTKAGFDLRESLIGLPAVAALATVGEIDMARGAQIVSGALHAYKLSAEDIPHIVDVIGKAAAISATDISEMGTAMSYTTELSALFDIQLEETAAMIATLAQRSIVSSKAGTSLRNMFTRLSAPVPKAARALEMLNFTMFEADGSAKDVTTSIQELSDAFLQFDAKTRARLAQDIFGRRAAKAALALIEGARTVFPDFLRKISDSSEGIGFMQMAMENLADTTKGEAVRAMNALQVSFIDAFKDASPTIREVTRGLREMFASADFQVGLNSLVAGVAKFVGFLTANIVALVKLAGAYVVVKLAMKGLIALANPAFTMFSGLTSRFLLMETGATALGTSLMGMITALGPWGAAIAGAAIVATAAWAAYALAATDANEQVTKSILQESRTVNDVLKRQAQRIRDNIKLREEAARGPTGGATLQETVDAKLAKIDIQLAELDKVRAQQAGPDAAGLDLLVGPSSADTQAFDLAEARNDLIKNRADILAQEARQVQIGLQLDKERQEKAKLFAEMDLPKYLSMTKEQLAIERKRLETQVEFDQKAGKYHLNTEEAIQFNLQLDQLGVKLLSMSAFFLTTASTPLEKFRAEMKKSTAEIQWQIDTFDQYEGKMRSSASATLDFELAHGKMFEAFRLKEAAEGGSIASDEDREKVAAAKREAAEKDFAAEQLRQLKLGAGIKNEIKATEERTAAIWLGVEAQAAANVRASQAKRGEGELNIVNRAALEVLVDKTAELKRQEGAKKAYDSLDAYKNKLIANAEVLEDQAARSEILGSKTGKTAIATVEAALAVGALKKQYQELLKVRPDLAAKMKSDMVEAAEAADTATKSMASDKVEERLQTQIRKLKERTAAVGLGQRATLTAQLAAQILGKKASATIDKESESWIELTNEVDKFLAKLRAVRTAQDELAHQNKLNDIGTSMTGSVTGTREMIEIQAQANLAKKIAAIKLKEPDDKKYRTDLINREIRQTQELIYVQKQAYDFSREMTTGFTSAWLAYEEGATNAATQSAQIFQTATKGMEDAMVDFAMTGKLSFRDLANAVISDLVRIGTQMMIVFAIKSAIAVFGAKDGAVMQGGSPTGFAQGGALYLGKQLRKYSAGGIVTRPTIFPMADGGIGLMGEAGAEAIMPLARDSKNRLGVAAVGAGEPREQNIEVSQVFHIDARGADPGTESRIRAAVTEAAKAGYNMVYQDVSRRGPIRRKIG